ncbi:MAG: SdpI family protein [Gemmatimonadaceae bacterium]
MSESDAAVNGFTIMFVCAALLFAAVSVPLIRERVKPNNWYGFRTAKTLSDERIWYAANVYSGRLLCALGTLLAVAVVSLRQVPGVAASLATYCFVCGVLFTVGLLIVTGLSLRFVDGL